MNSDSNKEWEAIKAAYLCQVEKALSSVKHPQWREVLENVSSHLDQRFAALSPGQRTCQELGAIIDEMGPASDYAELLDPQARPQRPGGVRRYWPVAVVAVALTGCAVLALMLMPGLLGKGRIVDKIDYPFVNDPEAIGRWESVDFVQEIEDFVPQVKQWPGDLYLKQMLIHKNGRTGGPWTWTKGLIINSEDKTAAKYEIKKVDNATYMFFEWKSGDYTIRHMKPRYYVLKKTSLDTSSSKTLESPTMKSPTGVSQSQAGREPSVGVNRNDIVKAQREKRSGELNIVRALSSATVSWLKSGKSSDAEECDRLIDELLNQPEPRVEAYFVAAKVAELRNRPDKAISALQDVIRKHGDDKAPHLNTPAKVMGNLWIGTLYRHSGNIAQARAIYEALLTDLKAIPNRSDDELSAYVLIICNLYLAELAEATKDTDMVLERLNNIEAIKEPSVTTKPGEGQLFLNIFNIYKNWAGYQGKVKTMGKDQAVKQLTQDREEMGLMPLFALGWLKMTGITIEPQVGFYDDDARIMLDTSLERVIQDNVSDIDRALARLALGNLLVRSSEFSKAERYYSNVLESDCYFSPVAGIHLALCQTEQGKTKDAEMTLEKVNKKYPGCKAAVDEVAKHIRENKSPLTKP